MHRALIDQIVEEDEDLLARYLDEGTDPSVEELHAPFENALRAGPLIPILFVSAKDGAGVPQFMLDRPGSQKWQRTRRRAFPPKLAFSGRTPGRSGGSRVRSPFPFTGSSCDGTRVEDQTAASVFREI
jgi:hypothetical protein